MSKALIIHHGNITYTPNSPLGDITYTEGYISTTFGSSSSPCVCFKGTKYSLAQLWGSDDDIEAWFVGNEHSSFLYSPDGGSNWNKRPAGWSTGSQSIPSANLKFFSEAQSDFRTLRYRLSVTTDYETSLGHSIPTTSSQNLSDWYVDFLKASLNNAAVSSGYIRYGDPDSGYHTVEVQIAAMPFVSGKGFVILAIDANGNVRRNVFVSLVNSPVNNNTCWSVSPVYVMDADSSGNTPIEFIVQTADGKLYLCGFLLTTNTAVFRIIKDSNGNDVVIEDVIKNWDREGGTWICPAYSNKPFKTFNGYWTVSAFTHSAKYTPLATPIEGYGAPYAFRSFKKLTYPIVNDEYYIYSDGRHIYSPSVSTPLFDMSNVTDPTNEPLNTDREFQFYTHSTASSSYCSLICVSEQKIIKIKFPANNLAGYTSATPVWIGNCPIIKVACFSILSSDVISLFIYGIDAAGTANGWTYDKSGSGIDTTVTSQFTYNDAYNILACYDDIENPIVGNGWFFIKNEITYWTDINGSNSFDQIAVRGTVADVDLDPVSSKVLVLGTTFYKLFAPNSIDLVFDITFSNGASITGADTTLKRYTFLITTNNRIEPLMLNPSLRRNIVHVFAYAALNPAIQEGQRYVLWTKADLISDGDFEPLSDLQFTKNKITAVKDIYAWNGYIIVHGSSAVKEHVWYKVRLTLNGTWESSEITCGMPYDEVLEPCATVDYIVFIGKTTHKIYFTNLERSSSYTYQLSNPDSNIIGIVQTTGNHFTIFESNGSYGYLDFELVNKTDSLLDYIE